jgi:hypothetical protein
MKYLTAAAIAALTACSAPGASTPPISSAAPIAQAQPASPACFFRQVFVKNRELYKRKSGATPVVAVVAHKAGHLYISYAVWNHLNASSITVTPQGLPSVDVAARAHTTLTSLLPDGAKRITIQQDTAERDSGPGVEVNGRVCNPGTSARTDRKAHHGTQS